MLLNTCIHELNRIAGWDLCLSAAQRYDLNYLGRQRTRNPYRVCLVSASIFWGSSLNKRLVTSALPCIRSSKPSRVVQSVNSMGTTSSWEAIATPLPDTNLRGWGEECRQRGVHLCYELAARTLWCRLSLDQNKREHFCSMVGIWASGTACIHEYSYASRTERSLEMTWVFLFMLVWKTQHDMCH